LQRIGLTDDTIKIIEASKSKGTWTQYNSVFRKWNEYCKLQKLDTSKPNVNNVLEFLTSLYKANLGYSVVNTARSALSSLLGSVDGKPIGEHKLVLDFMKGVSRLRPAAPRYSITWDPDIVLKFLSSLETSKCTLKDLTMKIVALLALCTGQRVQTLSSIELANIIWGDCIQIKLTANLKTTIKSKGNPILKIPAFSDSKLCPHLALRTYVKLTEKIRNGEPKLFIGLVKPHKAVCPQTMSRWLVTVLNLSGIDTKTFHAHSFRHASTSKAAASGVNIDTIFSHVGWSSKSNTFAKFYQRPISEVNEFSNNVLAIKNVTQ